MQALLASAVQENLLLNSLVSAASGTDARYTDMSSCLMKLTQTSRARRHSASDEHHMRSTNLLSNLACISEDFCHRC
eukprot:7729-Heterococcus_DN1.PRE.2